MARTTVPHHFRLRPVGDAINFKVTEIRAAGRKAVSSVGVQ
jgi:hypothetical protein